MKQLTSSNHQMLIFFILLINWYISIGMYSMMTDNLDAKRLSEILQLILLNGLFCSSQSHHMAFICIIYKGLSLNCKSTWMQSTLSAQKERKKHSHNICANSICWWRSWDLIESSGTPTETDLMVSHVPNLCSKIILIAPFFSPQFVHQRALTRLFLHCKT